MTLPFWPNLFYQLTHLWHWLAYGQNAAAVGILGLLAYTWYTRGIHKLALAVRIAEIFPYLVLEKDSPQGEIVIRNIGGPAVHLTMWSQAVSDAFKLEGFFLEADVSFEFGGSLSKLESVQLAPDETDAPGARTLYVIDCP